MTAGQLGNAWLASCPAVAATSEMWRAWTFGPLPVEDPETTGPTGGHAVPFITQRPVPVRRDQDADLFFALI